MGPKVHSITSLFDQLGLSSTHDAIAVFVRQSGPLPAHVLLSEAEFWTASQAAFLQQMHSEDADWAGVVDQLNMMLR